MQSLSNPSHGAADQSQPLAGSAKRASVVRTMEEVLASSMPREKFLRRRLADIRDLGSLFVIVPLVLLALVVIYYSSGGDIFNASLWKPAVDSVGMEVSSMVLAMFGLAFFHLSCDTVREKLEFLDAKRARVLGMTLPAFIAARAKNLAEVRLAKEKLAASRAKAKTARELAARGL